MVVIVRKHHAVCYNLPHIDPTKLEDNKITHRVYDRNRKTLYSFDDFFNHKMIYSIGNSYSIYN